MLYPRKTVNSGTKCRDTRLTGTVPEGVPVDELSRPEVFGFQCFRYRDRVSRRTLFRERDGTVPLSLESVPVSVPEAEA